MLVGENPHAKWVYTQHDLCHGGKSVSIHCRIHFGYILACSSSLLSQVFDSATFDAGAWFVVIKVMFDVHRQKLSPQFTTVRS